MGSCCQANRGSYENQTKIHLKKNDNQYKVFPESNINTNEERKKESQIVIYKEDMDKEEIFSIKEIFGNEEVDLQKVCFGNNHILFLFKDKKKDKTYLAGLGSNAHGQLGLPVTNRENFEDDYTKANYKSKITLIYNPNSNEKIIDIAASGDYSYILKEDPKDKNKTILIRFEITEESLFQMDSKNMKLHSPENVEKLPGEIIKATQIYANRDRILLLNDDRKKIFLKGLTYNLDPKKKFNLFHASDKRITQVAMGEEHCMILLEDNSILTCGQNEYEQLGRENETSLNKFKPLDEKLNIKIKKIISGLRHNFILGEDTLCYFGDNSSKQCLGAEQKIKLSNEIKKGNLPTESIFEDIICGGLFTIGMNKKKEILGWGKCSFLFKDDIINKGDEAISLPKVMTDLKCKNVKGMFAGEKEVCFYIE